MKKRSNRLLQPKVVHLKLQGSDPREYFIGVRAVPGRLGMMLRYPGEPAAAFCNRVLHAVSGDGPLVAHLMYASDAPPPGVLLH